MFKAGLPRVLKVLIQRMPSEMQTIYTICLAEYDSSNPMRKLRLSKLSKGNEIAPFDKLTDEGSARFGSRGILYLHAGI